MLQADTKKAVNKDLSNFNKGLSLTQHLPVTVMTERPRKSAALEATPKREIYTSYFPSQLMRMR